MKNLLVKIIFGFLTLIFAVFILEYGAKIFFGKIANNDRLFIANETLGWINIPGADLKRTNDRGEIWNIKINNLGFRTEESFDPGAPKRILILGDSFAFGQSINEENRFDSLIARQKPDWSIVNLGMMAYSTDQEFIAGRRFFSDLKKGDVLILLTYANDFTDLLKKSINGRAKPWLEIRDGKLIEHPPALGILRRLRDRSYIAGWLLSRFFNGSEQIYGSVDVLKDGFAIYQALLNREIAPLTERGVEVIIVYHGDFTLQNSIKGFMPFLTKRLFADICSGANPSCLFLDEKLLSAPELIFFNDLHWNKKGHRIVSEAILEKINENAD